MTDSDQPFFECYKAVAGLKYSRDSERQDTSGFALNSEAARGLIHFYDNLEALLRYAGRIGKFEEVSCEAALNACANIMEFGISQRIATASSNLETRAEIVRHLVNGTVPIRATIFKIQPGGAVSLAYDRRFINPGIQTNSSGLIDQSKTLELWKDSKNVSPTSPAQAGKLPLQFLADLKPPALLFMPNHFGWQGHEGLVVDGQFNLTTVHGLQGTPSPHLIGFTSNATWVYRMLPTDDQGKFLRTSIEGIKVGWTGTPLISNGRRVPIDELIHALRIAGDFRNLINLVPQQKDKIQDGRFFVEHRRGPLELITPEIAERLYKGEMLEVSGEVSMTQEGFNLINDPNVSTEEFREYFKFTYLANTTREGGTLTMKIKKPLPHASIPLTVVGVTAKGELVSIFVDGRQGDTRVSEGITIEAAQELALKYNLIHAFIGPAGNDVAAMSYQEGKVLLLNSPAAGNHQAREMPSLLVLQ